eukprot:9358757-Heterocapsa_arctica.AAC.1
MTEQASDDGRGSASGMLAGSAGDVARMTAGTVSKLRVGQQWDLLVGGVKHNILAQGPQDIAGKQLATTMVNLYAPECKMLSRARDRPIWGA